MVKSPVKETRDVDLIPGSGKSPVGGHGNSLLYSFLENLMDRGAWWLQSIVQESDATKVT